VGAVVTLQDVRHRRGGRDILRLDHLEVPAGARVAVLGPNGAGKTTLLRLLAGIDHPVTGVIRIDGTPTTGLSMIQRRRITFVTQQPGLLTTTVRRNIDLPLAWRGIHRPERRHRVDAVLDQLGLTGLADRSAPTLSGGEQQRVNLARALATDPTLLLLDEPAAALDVDARHRFLADAARAVTDLGCTLVHVSHRPEEALHGADLVAILLRGSLSQLDTPAAILRAPTDAAVARLVGYHNLLPATIDAQGHVCVLGRPTAITTQRPPGPATVAIWANGITITADQPDVRATVTTVTSAAGEWRITLTAGHTITVHQGWGQTPPSPGDQVGLRFDPRLAAVTSIAPGGQVGP
jgi:ABC-type sulfate/molybdate transport systems ATPase subunit